MSDPGDEHDTDALAVEERLRRGLADEGSWRIVTAASSDGIGRRVRRRRRVHATGLVLSAVLVVVLVGAVALHRPGIATEASIAARVNPAGVQSPPTGTGPALPSMHGSGPSRVGETSPAAAPRSTASSNSSPTHQTIVLGPPSGVGNVTGKVSSPSATESPSAGPAAASREVPLPAHAETGTQPKALLGGALVGDARRACLWLDLGQGRIQGVSWPQGYSVRLPQLQLVDPGGRVIATAGESIFGGGATAAVDAAPPHCSSGADSSVAVLFAPISTG